jgi:plasmid stabilization system protein ParE
MAAEVRFTQNFEDNLGAIQEFLLACSPDTAVDQFNALLQEIAAVASLLSQHPAIGRPMQSARHPDSKTGLAWKHLTSRMRALRMGDLREYVLHEYVVLYAATRDTVHLLAVKHQRQLSPLANTAFSSAPSGCPGEAGVYRLESTTPGKAWQSRGREL